MMCFEELLNVVMVADHVEVKQAVICGKDHAHGARDVEALLRGRNVPN